MKSFIAAVLLLGITAGCSDRKKEDSPAAEPKKTPSPAAAAIAAPVVQLAAEADNAISAEIAGVDPQLNAFAADIKKILPDFANFGRRNGREVMLLDAAGSQLALLRLPPDNYERTKGHKDFVDTAVVMQNDRIIGVVLGKNRETPRYLDRVRNAGFLTRWNGKSLSEAAELQVDAVTGATRSSKAISSEVKITVMP